MRDDAEVLTNMQSYLRGLLLEEVNTSGPQPRPPSDSSESMASTAVDRGWSLPQRLLVRMMGLSLEHMHVWWYSLCLLTYKFVSIMHAVCIGLQAPQR